MAILIQNATLIRSADDEVIAGSIRIEADRIVSVGGDVEAQEEDEIIDGSHLLVTPGLVNAHIHPTHAISKGVADNLSYQGLLHFLHSLNYEKDESDRYWTSIQSLVESIKLGVTSVYILTGTIEGEVKAVEDTGLRAAATKAYHDVYLGEGAAPERYSLGHITEDIDRIMEELPSERVSVHLGFGNDLSASKELLQLLQQKAAKHRTRLNGHAAEHADSVAAYKKLYGDGTVTYMHKTGFLTAELTLIHMTQLTEEEIGYVADAGVNIVHCPVGNAKLADGICPVPELQKAGVNVALGTDASINNNTSHLLNEAYFAGLLHSVNQMNPKLLPPRELFRMLTINGAKAMGLENEIGTLEVGKKADIAIYDMRTDAFTPCYDPFSNLIYNAPDVRAHGVLVDGKWVLKDGEVQTVDAEEVRTEVNQRSIKIEKAFADIQKLG